jgi:dynein light intermediate chain
MCEVAVKDDKKYTPRKKKEKPPLVCEDWLNEFPKLITMVKWSRPALLTKFRGLGRKPSPEGGYVEYKVDPGFPMRPKIPGLLGPPVTLEDTDTTIEETAEILNIIFKPKKWQEGERKWHQEVSPLPAKRADVIHLTEELNVRLLRSDARPRGICSIRQYLFSQCFDEIIRQVTVNCAERGILLCNIRDELMLTLKTYQQLVDYAIGFGLQKVEEAKQEEEELRREYEALLARKKALEAQNQEGKLKMARMSRRYRDQRKSTEATRNLRLAYVQRSNDQFFYMLDNIGMDKKLFFHLM